ncbi:hypothetical protein MMSP_5298 [Mycobacterium sp. 012931]|nr:hypothetical protein MMSP_5298 [Mycobacterium sp. 012931]
MRSVSHFLGIVDPRAPGLDPGRDQSGVGPISGAVAAV